MIAKDITYRDYDGVERTERFYFNLNETEILRLQLSHDGGLEAYLRRIIAAQNNQELFSTFERIIKAAYGIKSDDGKRLDKSDEAYNSFAQTEAYNKLILELVQDDKAAANFINSLSNSPQDHKSASNVVDMKTNDQN